MGNALEKAIVLRNIGKYKESNELLLRLVSEFPNDPIINFQCAWSFDVLGEESKAVGFYEKAIELGLQDEDLQGAILGLGSTYRTLGEYEKSKKVLQKGMDQFPDSRSIQVFFSMTLYNLGEHSSAMELLLKCLAETTSDREIIKYKKAINFYSNHLDKA
ncbi:tetratricopeptide repeat protein [Bacillus sp. ISL-47]|uniref:tetratricopeptide repeat protein n=1 Tax=Bacillus sp. ISL-47 TaxID=2819130 RepID=UPI001BE614EF|nr:tetratricopeptide repeat protein [Bacillus sp. ISL-47]MBT2687730.1 tetratricopeptide repeat protein [Bacillus sp. ISL-47]